MSTVSLLSEIRSLLGTGAISYNSKSAANDAYEGFLFAIIVATARDCGASVRYETVHDEPATKLIFPTSPIRIHWDAQDYAHAVINFGPGIPELEAHIGVRVEGTSGVEHECDVLVLEASEARACRRGLRSPKASKCVLAVECKYYLSHLPLGVARSFAGLKRDLAKPELIFASNNNSGSVNAYFNKHSYTRELGAGPRSREADHLRSHIRNGFRTHVATHDPGYPI